MYMLDTDTCIYLINSRDDTLRETFETNAASICISSISYAELCFGVAYSEQAERNSRELKAFCLDLEIQPFDAAAGTHYGEIRHYLSRDGRLIGANDLLIAAHARSAQATLVTNNEKEFRRVPALKVENWLAAARNRQPDY